MIRTDEARSPHRGGLVLQAGAAQREQVSLLGQGPLEVLPLHERPALGSCFSSQLTSVVRRPMSAYSSSTCFSWAAACATCSDYSGHPLR